MSTCWKMIHIHTLKTMSILFIVATAVSLVGCAETQEEAAKRAIASLHEAYSLYSAEMNHKDFESTAAMLAMHQAARGQLADTLSEVDVTPADTTFQNAWADLRLELKTVVELPGEDPYSEAIKKAKTKEAVSGFVAQAAKYDLYAGRILTENEH